jgi:hypothetical protein
LLRFHDFFAFVQVINKLRVEKFSWPLHHNNDKEYKLLLQGLLGKSIRLIAFDR